MAIAALTVTHLASSNNEDAGSFRARPPCDAALSTSARAPDVRQTPGVPVQ